MRLKRLEVNITLVIGRGEGLKDLNAEELPGIAPKVPEAVDQLLRRAVQAVVDLRGA